MVLFEQNPERHLHQASGTIGLSLGPLCDPFPGAAAWAWVDRPVPGSGGQKECVPRGQLENHRLLGEYPLCHSLGASYLAAEV